MPIIHNSSYKAPLFLRHPDLQTVLTSKLRPYHKISVVRQRLELPDDDFIDIDVHFSTKIEEEKRAVIISHGLEGNSNRRYMVGMASACAERGWDVVLRNFRGCSGEMNRLPHFYHGGETGDLDFVVRWAIAQGYTTLTLIGFSMGGNQTLKYLGEMGRASANSGEILPKAVRCAVTFSVPCDFVSGAQKIDEPRNARYLAYFMRSLKAKIRAKATHFPHDIDVTNLNSMTTFTEFDNHYTAPMFGFSSALDYWKQASCKPYLPFISIPTLVINALDDPFLAPPCYPFEEARNNSDLYLEVPHHGGHVGFMSINWANRFWSEVRAVDFIEKIIGC